MEVQASGPPTICTDTLPKEINGTPLVHRISLDEPVSKWAQMLESALTDEMIHKDMRPYIIKSGYDMKKLFSRLQRYYLKKYEFYSKK